MQFTFRKRIQDILAGDWQQEIIALPYQMQKNRISAHLGRLYVFPHYWPQVCRCRGYLYERKRIIIFGLE